MLTRLKVITSYTGLARFLAECGEKPIGSVPSEIRTPYAYSQTHVVWDWAGVPVIIPETRHRRYEVYRVDGPLGPIDE